MSAAGRSEVRLTVVNESNLHELRFNVASLLQVKPKLSTSLVAEVKEERLACPDHFVMKSEKKFSSGLPCLAVFSR